MKSHTGRQHKLLSLVLRARIYVLTLLALLVLGFAAGSVYAAGTISGTAYRDFNGNGAKETGEIGIGGIGVEVFDSTNTSQGTDTTAADGSYSIGPNGGTPPYRVEFTIPAAPDPLAVYKSGPAGTGSDTSVQFVTDGAHSNVNFGVNYPGDFCENNPQLCTTSYVNGDRTDASVSSLGALYEWEYDNTTDTPAPDETATAGQIGSTWGLALARSTRQLYIGAVLKRHVDIGPGGGTTPEPYGTIYVRDVSGTGAPTYFATIPNADSVSTRDLGDATSPSHDTEAYAKVGKIGLGGLTISDDETTLYVVNLSDKSVYPVTIATATVGTPIAIPDPGCTNGTYRPWAAKFWRGLLYVGMVCDASASGTKADLEAIVYTYDPVGATWSASPVLRDSLEMSSPSKGEIVNCDVSYSDDNGFHPWSDAGDTATLATNAYFCRNSGATGAPKIEIHPMPILSDIEFDVDGSMMLGITDRFGNMIGWRNWGINSDTNIYDVIVGGDVLRACDADNNSVWDLEDNGECGGVTSAGANNAQGIGGGEFYFGDETPADGSQKESAEGGLAFVPGKLEVVSTAQDPYNKTIAQGVIFQNNSGANVGDNSHTGYELYVNSTGNSLVPTFGKANGLGDLIALCNIAPVEIGNRVWNDVNGNGLQDAGEAVFSGVDVQLWVDTNDDDEPDTQIATARTDANGNYYFSNDPRGYPGTGNSAPNAVSGSTAGGFSDDGQGGRTSTASHKYGLLALVTDQKFEIRIDPASTQNSAILAGFNLTTQNANSDGNDNIDSDASLDGSIIVVTGSTAGVGNNDHTFDIGFYQSPALGTIGNRVWIDEDSNGYQDKGEDGIPNVTVQLKDSGGTVIATQITDANGGYLFTDLAAGTYYVQVLGSTIPTGMTQTTTYPNAGADFYNQDQSGTGYQIDLGPGEVNLSADFGYNWNPTSAVTTGGPANTVAALGDRIWIDINGNGAQDDAEVGVSGAVLTLFGGPGPDGVWGNGDDEEYSAGGYDPHRVTDANGNYMYDNLPPGQYSVRVTSSAGANYDILTGLYSQTGDPDHYGTTGAVNDNQTTLPVVLGPGDVFLNADFGYRPGGGDGSPQLGSIGNFIWYDRDADGVGPTVGGEAHGAAPGNDNTEFGIGGVTVALIRDLNGDGVWDAGEPIIATTHTSDGTEDVDNDGTVDYLGYYNFRGLAVTNGVGTDDYIVWVNDTNRVLNGLRATYDQNGTDPTTGQATGLGISSVQDLTTTPVIDQDFGYTDEQVLDAPTDAGVLGDRVWLDTNGNSNQDAGEPGIPGVTVELYDSTGTTLLATTTTGFDGYYLFPNLPTSAGGITYVVKVDTTTLPGGLTQTYDYDGLGTANESSRTLTDAEPIQLDQDFGYQGPGTIGNFVWLDTNANGSVDGSDASQGIGGVTIDLYYDANGNGKVDANEIKLGTTTTAADGSYLFTGLPVDDGGGDAQYVVNVSDTAGVLAGYWHSIGNQAQGSNNTSKYSPYAVTLSTGTPDVLTVDFGYYVVPGAVGNYVWYDTDADGVQDGTEVGINGVTVTLTIRYPGADNTLNTGDDTITTITTVTDVDPTGTRDGYYTFGNLLQDENYNGLGTYYTEPEHTITLTPPANYTTSPTGNGTATTDSNDPTGTAAQPFKGQINTSFANDSAAISSYDYGIYRLRLFGTVFLDIFNGSYNGTYDGATETPSGGAESGLTVYLYADANNDNIPDGAPVQTTTTNATGDYDFESLEPGRYIVSVVLPSGWRSTIDTYDAADTADPQVGTNNNDNGIGGTIGQVFAHSFNLIAGSTGSHNLVVNTLAFTSNDRIDFGMNQSPTAAEMQDVAAASADGTSVLVSWLTLNERLVSGFNVQRSDTSEGAYVNVNADFIPARTPGSDLGNTYEFSDGTVTAGATYWYRIELVRADATIDYSDPVQVVVGASACVGKPAATTLVGPIDTVTAKKGKVVFKWSKVPCAVTYKFQLRLGTPDGRVLANQAGLKKVRVNRKDLQERGTYVWRVLACNSANRCTATAWQTFRVKKER